LKSSCLLWHSFFACQTNKAATMRIDASKNRTSRFCLVLFCLFHGCLPTTDGFASTSTRTSTRTSRHYTATPARRISTKPLDTTFCSRHLTCPPVDTRCNTRLRVGQAISQDVDKPKPRFEAWSNFMYGAKHVDSQYLDLFWEYCIRRTTLLIGPVVILLVAAHYLSPGFGSFLYSSFNQLLQIMFLVSSFVGGILQLPLDALRWVWHAFPAFCMPMLDYLPSGIAIHLARMMLFLQHELRVISHSYIFASLAVVFWRPMVEEVQYRFLLFRLLGQKRQEQSPQKSMQESTNHDSSLVDFIPLDPSSPTQPTMDNGADTTMDTKSLKLSRKVLLSSVLFAATRLGWLCALPDTVFSPSVWKIGFLQSATAPYVWTVGFIQSIMAHFSSSVLSEWAPLLQNGLLVLALHQSVSTFLVARHIFVPLYEERGLAASVGAHVAWTVGKATIPFRLVWKLLPSSARFGTSRRR
jgi:hypothetical protein